MLKHEEAEARLVQWELPDDSQELRDRLGKLPKDLQDIATILAEPVGKKATWYSPEWFEHENRQDEAAAALDKLPQAQRLRVFEAISPHLAQPVERAWQLLKTAPYQTGYSRKAFRAPGRADKARGNLRGFVTTLALLARKYRLDVVTAPWLAAWLPHINLDYRSLGYVFAPLFAALIDQRDAEGEEVFENLRQSLRNEHEIGQPGRHIFNGFLLSSRPEAWDLIEKMLLAAQRQEGLRQAILEYVDFAHPGAFRRMMRLILEHDLMRFSSVVRAVDVWFGHLWAAASPGVIKRMLTQVVGFLEDPKARDKAFQGKDAEAAFLALWSLATEDAIASIPIAEKLLASKSAEIRFVAAKHLVSLDLDEASAALVPALEDSDLRIAITALSCNAIETLPGNNKDDRFERIERLYERLPEKPQKLEALVWPWTSVEVERSDVARCLVFGRRDRPVARILPYLRVLDPRDRAQAIRELASATPWDPETRQTIVDLAGDAAADVRNTCLKALAKNQTTSEEAIQLESYLTRKASDLRQGILNVFLSQNDDAALASGERLCTSKDVNQRLAGLELVRLLAEAGRSEEACRQRANQYRSTRGKITKLEEAHLAEILKEKSSVPKLDDALGLMDPRQRTPTIAPRRLDVAFITPAAVACLKALDELVHEHRETPIVCESYSGEKTEHLLGTARWEFREPSVQKRRDKQREKLPLAETWIGWLNDRPTNLRDVDGLELVRAMLWLDACHYRNTPFQDWIEDAPHRKAFVDAFTGGEPAFELRYKEIVRKVLEWLLFLFPVDARDYLLDAMETAFARVPEKDMAQLIETPTETKDEGAQWMYRDDAQRDWRHCPAFVMWPESILDAERRSGVELTAPQKVRRWQLLHWRDQPLAGAGRLRPDTDLLKEAYDLGAANLTDVADHLLGPRGKERWGEESFQLLKELTVRAPLPADQKWLERHPEVRDLVDRAVGRILDLELSRGDAGTAANRPAQAIGCLRGIATLRRILQVLGNSEFKPTGYWRTGNMDRRQTLTKLAEVTWPADDETPEDFSRTMKAAVKAGEFPHERVLQLVFLAPQWVKHVEAYLGWQDMSEGVYWFLAHMRFVGGKEDAAIAAGIEEEPVEETPTDNEDDEETSARPERKLTPWERLVVERTPLTHQERNEGAIDVAWFRRTFDQLGEKRWQALAAAARFAATPAQAKHAEFISRVLLGRVKRAELVEGIKKRQLKEHVRLLGLLPLVGGAKRKQDLMERCKIFRDYRRYANQLSGLTKPSALRAWEIGMKNLALTAGYGDASRLEWAVTAESVKDLARGPVTTSKNGVSVTLALDDLSRPDVTVRKGDKELKSIPPDLKKDKKIAELTSRVTDLKRQASSIRQSLEAAMCRGDTFTGEELRGWYDHALLRPLISRLVVVGEGIFGYPDKGGRVLFDHRGKSEPVKAKETLRLAHPFDLLSSDDWHLWQRECFQAERVQPFKQVFRELYVITKQEKKDATQSRRYAGQQVQPRQALALFGSRGWDTRDGIFKVFHDHGLIASVFFQHGIGTPLEVEDATIDTVRFTRRDEWKPLPLADIPPRLFSEVMRDLDLVVSVAHSGGVDPEASASTVEMRSGLLRETCTLLGLKNVRLKPSHALVDGDLADYSVHLGSGTVHKLPGGSLCIVPVHAQHRGRLFLPFADDDPRTAEVISKVLLLARDTEIQDPSILEQIRR